MSDNIAEKSQDGREAATGRPSRALLWLLLGGVLGALLAALFFAYGQPELLLEQMNLRYCG